MVIPEKSKINNWIGTVVSNENVATFIKELIIELPKGDIIPYRAGGYLKIHVPPFVTNSSEWKMTMHPKFQKNWEKWGLFDQPIDFSDLPKSPHEIVRPFSVASYPAEGRIIKFNIRISTPPLSENGGMTNVPWGTGTSYAFSLRPGDKIHLSGPYGESFMIDDERDIYFLIGGAGSSFARSHIMQLFKTEKTQRSVELWYGVRSLKENFYLEEYQRLTEEFPNFQYHLALSEPQPEDFEQGWPKNDPVKTNFLYKAFELGRLKDIKHPEDSIYFVCGPAMHNSSVLKLLDDYGVSRESIVLDDFGS